MVRSIVGWRILIFLRKEGSSLSRIDNNNFFFILMCWYSPSLWVARNCFSAGDLPLGLFFHPQLKAPVATLLTWAAALAMKSLRKAVLIRLAHYLIQIGLLRLDPFSLLVRRSDISPLKFVICDVSTQDNHKSVYEKCRLPPNNISFR